mgnify:CR=1 FL=1
MSEQHEHHSDEVIDHAVEHAFGAVYGAALAPIMAFEVLENRAEETVAKKSVRPFLRALLEAPLTFITYPVKSARDGFRKMMADD